MTHSNKDNINARSGESSDVKQSSGRRSKAYYQADVSEVLNMSAKTAARMLQDHLDQKKGRKTLKSSLQRACEFVIDHAIGKSRQKVEHSGGVMTYGELAKSADSLDAKPRPILSEVMEIANKYQAENPAPDGATGPDPGPESTTKTDDKPVDENS